MRQKLTAVARWLGRPLGLTLFITVLVLAFAWPTSHLGPRDVPVAVGGSPGFVAQVTDALRQADPNAFDIQVAPDRAIGRQLLRDNAVDGLFEETTSGPRLELAAAGRPAVTELLTGVESDLSDRPAGPSVTQGVAAPPDDPHSAVFTTAALPTILGAIALGVALSMLPGTRSNRVTRIAVVAGFSGITLTLVMHSWLGALTGDWWGTAGSYALGIGAVIGAICGLQNLFGRIGMMAAAAGLMLLGNPLSGASSAPELLPRGWSALGQALPPGALFSALRAVAFYGGHGATDHLLVLSAWFIVGLILLAAIPARERARRGSGPVTTLPTRDVPRQQQEPAVSMT